MSKTRKLRGSRTYGRGRGRSHNYGSGNRGGFGRAGSGKKGDAKKPSFWKNPFKKKAFGMQEGTDKKVINVGQVQERVEKLIAEGKVKADKKITLDLGKLGYEKLLGSGNIKYAVSITISEATEKAVTKVQNAKGDVKTPDSEVEQVSEKKEAKTAQPKPKTKKEE